MRNEPRTVLTRNRWRSLGKSSLPRLITDTFFRFLTGLALRAKTVSLMALVCTLNTACVSTAKDGRPSVIGDENSTTGSPLIQELEAKKLALLGKTPGFYSFVNSHPQSANASSRPENVKAVDIHKFGHPPNRTGVRIGIAMNQAKLCIEERVLLDTFESEIGTMTGIRSIRTEKATPPLNVWTLLETSRKGVFAFRMRSADRISVVAEFSVFGLKCLDAVHFTHEQ